MLVELLIGLVVFEFMLIGGLIVYTRKLAWRIEELEIANSLLMEAAMTSPPGFVGFSSIH